jgi:CRISPR-associated protein Csm4
MKTYRIDLSSETPSLTPFQADTMFGHLCWAVANHEGEKRIADFLAPFRDGHPPFIISDGFPTSLLPKPLSADFNIPDRVEAKEVRKLRFIDLDNFERVRKGGSVLIRQVAFPVVTHLTLHNSISRITNSVRPEGGLYGFVESFTPNITVYIKVISTEWKDRVIDLFKRVSESGYGKRKSIGRGRFHVDEKIDEFSFGEVENSNGFVTLSNFCPRKGDPIDGSYRTFVKYGKLGDAFTFCGNPFKRPLVMIRTGSVFRTAGQPMEYYGRMVENGIAPAKLEVAQYAYAFTVPLALNPCECLQNESRK